MTRGDFLPLCEQFFHSSKTHLVPDSFSEFVLVCILDNKLWKSPQSLWNLNLRQQSSFFKAIFSRSFFSLMLAFESPAGAPQ